MASPEIMSRPISSMSESPLMTHVQANEFLNVLNNTQLIVQNYISILEESREKPLAKTKSSWWGRHCWPQKRRVLYNHITIITLCLQFVNLLTLTLIDAWPRQDHEEETFLVAGAATMIVLQILNLCVLIMASGRLVKQIYRHSVNSFLLGQTYLATIISFAGLYTLTFRLERASWKFINEDLREDPVQVFILYAKFLFYSISTGTLCGSDNVLPVNWYNCIFAGFQMLLSFCFFASILGTAVSPELSKMLKAPAAKEGNEGTTNHAITLTTTTTNNNNNNITTPSAAPDYFSSSNKNDRGCTKINSSETIVTIDNPSTSDSPMTSQTTPSLEQPSSTTEGMNINVPSLAPVASSNDGYRF